MAVSNRCLVKFSLRFEILKRIYVTIHRKYIHTCSTTDAIFIVLFSLLDQFSLNFGKDAKVTIKANWVAQTDFSLCYLSELTLLTFMYAMLLSMLKINLC